MKNRITLSHAKLCMKRQRSLYERVAYVIGQYPTVLPMLCIALRAAFGRLSLRSAVAPEQRRLNQKDTQPCGRALSNFHRFLAKSARGVFSYGRGLRGRYRGYLPLPPASCEWQPACGCAQLRFVPD